MPSPMQIFAIIAMWVGFIAINGIWFSYLRRQRDRRRRRILERLVQEEGVQLWETPVRMRNLPFGDVPAFDIDRGIAELDPVIEFHDTDHTILVFWVVPKWGNRNDTAGRLYAAINLPGMAIPLFHADRQSLGYVTRASITLKPRVRLPDGKTWRICVENEGDGEVVRQMITGGVCAVVDRSRGCQFLEGNGEWLVTGGCIAPPDVPYGEMLQAAKDVYRAFIDKQHTSEWCTPEDRFDSPVK